jgi:hypothetical protein
MSAEISCLEVESRELPAGTADDVLEATEKTSQELRDRRLTISSALRFELYGRRSFSEAHPPVSESPSQMG